MPIWITKDTKSIIRKGEDMKDKFRYNKKENIIHTFLKLKMVIVQIYYLQPSLNKLIENMGKQR